MTNLEHYERLIKYIWITHNITKIILGRNPSKSVVRSSIYIWIFTNILNYALLHEKKNDPVNTTRENIIF